MSTAASAESEARPRSTPRARRRPDAATLAWAGAVGVVFAVALGLRLWGLRTGLPFVYNADENSHFVARAIGMFGHSYNPGYFINPPAYTYVLHVALWLRFGGREAVGASYAADPTEVFTIARAVCGLLGALAVAFLAWAGARMFDRRIGLVAALLLAVAFLPVHYGHFALNDVPTLAPLCLALAGVAGVLRRGRALDYALAGAGLGVACAMKYTAGILLLALLAAAALSAGPPGLRPRTGGLLLAGVLALAGFLVANPFALLDYDTFRAGLEKQTQTAGDETGKLGLTQDNGLLYYLGTLTWGLGWIPAVAAAGGVVGLARRDPGAALVLALPCVGLVAFLGTQERFFARWLLPIYPLLCLLAAWAAVRAAAWVLDRLRARDGRRRALLVTALAAVALCAQGLVYSVHNDRVLARADTRNLTREWMVGAIPEGSKVVVEPVFPDQWASDPGRPSRVTGNGTRWNKWPTSRSKVNNDGTIRKGRGRVVKLEDYERTTRPALVGSYIRGGYCWVVTGSTQAGRAYAEPEQVPDAIRYYDELRRRGRVVYRASPYREGAGPVPFSFDHSFTAYPLAYERPGPEIVIYRLGGCNG
jgi:4-amino-4-deoxy-L-arabinose transferase-like glycosyltransferase